MIHETIDEFHFRSLLRWLVITIGNDNWFNAFSGPDWIAFRKRKIFPTPHLNKVDLGGRVFGW